MGLRPGARPPADNPELDFMPRTPVATPIVVAHHHPIRFNDQHARGRCVGQCARWLVRRLHLGHGLSLLAFALGAQPFSMGPQRLTPDLHAGQFLKQLRRLTKRGARRHVRLPAGQPSAGALPRPEPERSISPAPALLTRPAAVPGPSERQAAHLRLDRAPPPPLGCSAATALRTGTPWWARGPTTRCGGPSGRGSGWGRMGSEGGWGTGAPAGTICGGRSVNSCIGPSFRPARALTRAGPFRDRTTLRRRHTRPVVPLPT